MRKNGVSRTWFYAKGRLKWVRKLSEIENHDFKKTCNKLGIKHSTTKVKYPWANAYVVSVNFNGVVRKKNNKRRIVKI